MNKFILKTILFTGIIFLNLTAAKYDFNNHIEFYSNEVFIPERLGDIKLYKDCDGFHIFKDGKIYNIQNCFCDEMLQRMSDEQLVKFLGRNKPKIIMLSPEEFDQINLDDFVEITGKQKAYILSQLFGSGHISVNQMDNGEYTLQAKTGLLGGWGWGFVAKVFAGNVVNVLVADVTVVLLGPVGLFVAAGIGGGTLAISIALALGSNIPVETTSANSQAPDANTATTPTATPDTNTKNSVKSSSASETVFDSEEPV